MTYRGIVQGGVVVFPPGVHLPEGLQVDIQPVPAQAPHTPARQPLTIRNGVPVFPRTQAGGGPGLELVNQLRDDTP